MIQIIFIALILYIINMGVKYIYTKYIIRKTCEDNYQNQKKSKHSNKQSVIIVNVKYSDNALSVDDVRNKCIKLSEETKDSTNANAILEIENIIDDINKFKSIKKFNHKTLVNKNEKTIISHINHEYIGGSKLAKTLFMTNTKEQKDLFYNTRWYYGFYLAKLYWNKNKIPKVPSESQLKLYESDDQICRYQLNYTIDKTKHKYPLKATIIHNVLRDIYLAIDSKKKLNRPLVCYLPIAFNTTKTVNNNIGIIWLQYEPSYTIDMIANQLKENSYQVLATNFLLYYNLVKKNQGTNTRKDVDAVITIIFSEDDQNISHSWSFPNVSDYPVYAAVSSILDEKNNNIYITQTLTVSTPEFDPEFDQKSLINLPNSANLSTSYKIIESDHYLKDD